MDKQTIKIIVIKTNQGFLITDNVRNETHFNSSIPNFLFDGEPVKNTFKRDWFKVKTKPEKIEKSVAQPPINKRWELKPEFVNSGFKKIWLYSEVFNKNSDVLEEFNNVKSLYEYKEEKQSNVLENVDFEWEEVIQIQIDFKEPQGFCYAVFKSSYITEKNLQYDFLTEILTPPVFLHTQPCKLSSKQTYDIIRAFIKNHINPQVAEITSDYDFCFTVCKKIPLAKPHSFKVDVNNSIFNKKKKKPKYETRFVTVKKTEIFEMTHAEFKGGYKGYTLIEPFQAENQEAMKEYIDEYLNNLIAVINEPLCECDKCNGTGVLKTTV